MEGSIFAALYISLVVVHVLDALDLLILIKRIKSFGITAVKQGCFELCSGNRPKTKCGTRNQTAICDFNITDVADLSNAFLWISQTFSRRQSPLEVVSIGIGIRISWTIFVPPESDFDLACITERGFRGLQGQQFAITRSQRLIAARNHVAVLKDLAFAASNSLLRRTISRCGSFLFLVDTDDDHRYVTYYRCSVFAEVLHPVGLLMEAFTDDAFLLEFLNQVRRCCTSDRVEPDDDGTFTCTQVLSIRRYNLFAQMFKRLVQCAVFHYIEALIDVFTIVGHYALQQRRRDLVFELIEEAKATKSSVFR